MVYQQYTWLYVITAPLAFVTAFGIGGNDFANSFASSVGSKSLSLWQAILLGAVFEFLGAVLLGAHVTDTIKGSIVRTAAFKDAPAVLMYVMFSSTCTAAFWDNITCAWEMPISTTHTIVSSIGGASMALHGFKAVQWHTWSHNFPYVKGVVTIITSWFCSPICAGVIVSILYGCLVRPFILRSPNSYARASSVVPLLVGLTVLVAVFFIIATGTKNNMWGDFAMWKALITSLGISLFFAIFTNIVINRPAMAAPAHLIAYPGTPTTPRTHTFEQAGSTEQRLVSAEQGRPRGFGTKVRPSTQIDVMADIYQAATFSTSFEDRISGMLSAVWQRSRLPWLVTYLRSTRLGRLVLHGFTYDMHVVVEDEIHEDYDPRVVAIWRRAQIFEWRTERLFRYLQIFSGCVMAFAHGASDVSNAIGPLAAIHNVWENRAVPTKTYVPVWMLAMGGLGISVGLALSGYNMVRMLGLKMTKLTNSRGFCVELSTAMVVMIAAYTGLPVSTTQTVCGSIVAMGILEGWNCVNWRLVGWMVAGWVLTLVVVSALSAGLASLALYAPSKVQTWDINHESAAIYNLTRSMITALNMTNHAPGVAFSGQLNSSLTGSSSHAAGSTGTGPVSEGPFQLSCAPAQAGSATDAGDLQLVQPVSLPAQAVVSCQ